MGLQESLIGHGAHRPIPTTMATIPSY